MCINRFLPVHLRADLTPFEISTHMNRVQDKVKAALDELAACMGSKGEKGDTGAAGTNGTNGTNGSNGSNGTNGTNGTNAADIFITVGVFIPVTFALITQPLWIGLGQSDYSTAPIEWPIYALSSVNGGFGNATKVYGLFHCSQYGGATGVTAIELTADGVAIAGTQTTFIGAGPAAIQCPLANIPSTANNIGVRILGDPTWTGSGTPYDIRGEIFFR